MLRYYGSDYQDYVCARPGLRVWLWSCARLEVCDLALARRFAVAFAAQQREAYSIYGTVTRSFR